MSAIVNWIPQELNKLSICRTLPELLNYFKIAESILTDLQRLHIEQNVLQALCLAWQWRYCFIITIDAINQGKEKD